MLGEMLQKSSRGKRIKIPEGENEYQRGIDEDN
jgi:hypothetical protein